MGGGLTRALRFLELWATGGAAITRRSSVAVDRSHPYTLAGKTISASSASSFSLQSPSWVSVLGGGPSAEASPAASAIVGCLRVLEDLAGGR